MRKSELLNRITTLLGGRAAEEIIYGDISTGAQNDLSRATDIARNMVESYGMSPELGQVYLAPRSQGNFLDTMPGMVSNFSHKTAERIDAEISKIVDEQYATALTILKENQSLLEHYAGQLLKKEVMEGQEIDKMAESIKMHGPPKPAVVKKNEGTKRAA